MDRFRVVHLDDVEAIPGAGTLTWRPVRAHLGIRAFGTGPYTAAQAGEDVVEPRARSSHEELSFVARGREPARAPSIIDEDLGPLLD
jgi:hypothetical protein